MGAMSKNGKNLIHEIANKISIIRNTDATLHVNRIRSNLLATMMKHNANMIIKCHDL